MKHYFLDAIKYNPNDIITNSSNTRVLNGEGNTGSGLDSGSW